MCSSNAVKYRDLIMVDVTLTKESWLCIVFHVDIKRSFLLSFMIPR